MKIQRKIWNYILILVLGMMGMITIIFFLVEKLLALFYFFFGFIVEYLDLSCRFCYNLLWVIAPKTE